MIADPVYDGFDLRLDVDGARRDPKVLSVEDRRILCVAADAVLKRRSGGVRLTGGDAFASVLGPEGVMGRIAVAALGDGARPVRAVLFDKTADNNWLVPWHQDRTIAVRERREIPGFGPWSVKGEIAHVEPPFALLEGMVTLRAHLDDCDEDNAPLLIAPGSHRLGRIPATEALGTAKRLGQRACIAHAGDVWTYAAPILHASERARRPRRRRVLHVDYAARPLPEGLEWMGIADGAEN